MSFFNVSEDYLTKRPKDTKFDPFLYVPVSPTAPRFELDLDPFADQYVPSHSRPQSPLFSSSHEYDPFLSCPWIPPISPSPWEQISDEHMMPQALVVPEHVPASIDVLQQKPALFQVRAGTHGDRNLWIETRLQKLSGHALWSDALSQKILRNYDPNDIITLDGGIVLSIHIEAQKIAQNINPEDITYFTLRKKISSAVQVWRKGEDSWITRQSPRDNTPEPPSSHDGHKNAVSALLVLNLTECYLRALNA